jgi:hypothetical protein
MNRLRPFAVLNQPHTGVQPDPAVAIELADTDRGFLPNRLTTDQRDAIADPPEGLTIYNTDTQTHELFDGSAWQQMAKGNIPPGLPSISDNGVDVLINPSFSITLTSADTTLNITNDGRLAVDVSNSGATFVVAGLPTVDPHNVGQIWNDAGTLKISAG